jgi:hypothetical protein
MIFQLLIKRKEKKIAAICIEQYIVKQLTTSRKSAFICLSSTTRLAETAVAPVVVPLAVATTISVSKSCINNQKKKKIILDLELQLYILNY